MRPEDVATTPVQTAKQIMEWWPTQRDHRFKVHADDLAILEKGIADALAQAAGVAEKTLRAIREDLDAYHVAAVEGELLDDRVCTALERMEVAEDALKAAGRLEKDHIGKGL